MLFIVFVDQLPKGVESVLKKDGTVTSHEGNVYKITEYNTTTNTQNTLLHTIKLNTSNKGSVAS